MLLFFCLFAFAAPELSRDGVYDGKTRIAKVESKKIPYAGQNVTITGSDKSVWVNMMVTAVGDGTAMATVAFPTLSRSLGYRIPTGKYEDLLAAWVAAGVFDAGGPQLTALTAWATAATVVVSNPNDTATLLAAYAESHPSPAYSPAPPAAAIFPPTVAGRPAYQPPAPAYQPPVSVRVEIHVECTDYVRLSRGGTGSTTYGRESPNSRFGYTLSPGDELCICDDMDHKQSCTSVGNSDMSIELGCTGFRTR